MSMLAKMVCSICRRGPMNGVSVVQTPNGWRCHDHPCKESREREQNKQKEISCRPSE